MYLSYIVDNHIAYKTNICIKLPKLAIRAAFRASCRFLSMNVDWSPLVITPITDRVFSLGFPKRIRPSSVCRRQKFYLHKYSTKNELCDRLFFLYNVQQCTIYIYWLNNHQTYWRGGGDGKNKGGNIFTNVTDTRHTVFECVGG